jgi:predicted phosphoribosyltransferase
MDSTRPRFRDRAEAGRLLAERLAHLREEKPIVLALPRGGVVVADAIAGALGAPLDVIVVRKIGAPFHEEFAVGALVDGDEPELSLDEDVLRGLGISLDDVRAVVAHELEELRRRETLYRGDRPRPEVRGRTVILVDDGIATGHSVRAALRALRRAGPAKIVVATPVAPPRTAEDLRGEADEVVTLLTPPWFRAVGEFYEQFPQTSDEEVIRLLRQASPPKREAGAARPHA